MHTGERKRVRVRGNVSRRIKGVRKVYERSENRGSWRDFAQVFIWWEWGWKRVRKEISNISRNLFPKSRKGLKSYTKL